MRLSGPAFAPSERIAQVEVVAEAAGGPSELELIKELKP